MRQAREIIRLKAASVSAHEISRRLGMPRSTVREALERAEGAGLSWPLPEGMNDDALEAALYANRRSKRGHRRVEEPDWANVHRELKRKHVTLTILWDEYIAENPGGYRYSRFCELYRAFEKTLSVTMRQTHAAGERLFVDYAGDGVPVVVDRLTGEVRMGQIFVAVLGASSLTFARASWTQTLPDWIDAHVGALEAIGGVPQLIVPDNAKTAIVKACFYDPQVNRTYADMAAHYGAALLPARPRKPRDKAKVESAVLIVERWLLGRLRRKTFYSLAEVNAAIDGMLKTLNEERPIRRLGVTRRQLFDEIDRPALKALPVEPYEYCEWRLHRVGIDYHVEIDAHYYSVPYRFARAQVEARLTVRGVEIFYRGERIAVHLRMSGNHKHTTISEHMPSSHRRYAGWTIERIREDARKIGPAAAALCEQILEARPHPERAIALVWASSACRPLWVRARRGRGGARHRDRREDLRLDQIHPRQQARSEAGAKACRGRGSDPSPQYPRRALLSLGDSDLLKHPTLDQLHVLGLYGMAKAFAELAETDEAKGIDRNDWLALLLDREASLRRDKRLTARLRAAKLRQQASIEDVDYRAARGLDRALFQKLAEGQWIDARDNLALVGPSGVGKSWLACAIGQKACRDNRSVVYHRWPKLCEDLALARGDGRHPRLIKSLGRADLLILDDFGLEPLDAGARHDLLEILEERYGRRSTIVTSQLPVTSWHEVIGDPTYADAILDRLVHNAHRVELVGESLRRARAKGAKTT
jgi:transposase/DNA replication protein DnaC